MSIYVNLSAEEYAQIPALRSTFLRAMLATTPKQAWANDAMTSDSEAKIFGRHLHCCVLEPERFERDVAVMPEFKGVGSRQMRAEWQLRNAGKIQVKPKVLEQLLAMRDSVLKHPHARAIFNCPGRNEVSGVWEDRSFGIKCKVRWDRLYSDGTTLLQADLKSTRNAQEDFFRYDLRTYGYDVEAVFYTRALESIYGVEHKRPFHFVAVEKAEPYRVEVYELTRSERTLGTQKMQRAMAVYAHCLKTNEWPDTPIFGAREGVA